MASFEEEIEGLALDSPLSDWEVNRILYGRSTPLVRHPVTGHLVSKSNRSGKGECSVAASEWRRGETTDTTFKALAKCRQMAAAHKQAGNLRAAGKEGHAQVLEARAVSGKVGAGNRKNLAAQLRDERAAKQGEGQGKPDESASRSNAPEFHNGTPLVKNSGSRHLKNWPENPNLGELTEHAKKKFGPRFYSVQLRTYGPGRHQVEVFTASNGYNGKSLKREATYDLGTSDIAPTPGVIEHPAHPPIQSAPVDHGPTLRGQGEKRRAAKGTRADRLDDLASQATAHHELIALDQGAKSKAYQSAIRRAIRIKRAADKERPELSPREAIALRQADTERFNEAMKTAPKKVIKLKPTTEAHKEARDAVGRALESRSAAESANREPGLDPERKGVFFAIAEKKYREAQGPMREVRKEQRRDKALNAPQSNRSSEESTGKQGPTRESAPTPSLEAQGYREIGPAAKAKAKAAPKPPKSEWAGVVAPIPTAGEPGRFASVAEAAAAHPVGSKVAVEFGGTEPSRYRVVGHREKVDKYGHIAPYYTAVLKHESGFNYKGIKTLSDAHWAAHTFGKVTSEGKPEAGGKQAKSAPTSAPASTTPPAPASKPTPRGRTTKAAQSTAPRLDPAGPESFHETVDRLTNRQFRHGDYIAHNDMGLVQGEITGSGVIGKNPGVPGYKVRGPRGEQHFIPHDSAKPLGYQLPEHNRRDQPPAAKQPAAPAKPATKAAAPAPPVAPAPPATHDLTTFAARVKDIANGVGPEGRFHDNKVFISHAHQAYEAKHGKMPLDEFKSNLLAANNQRHLNLSRADMVSAMDPNKVKASEAKFGQDEKGYGGNSFHFILNEKPSDKPAVDWKALADKAKAEYRAQQAETLKGARKSGAVPLGRGGVLNAAHEMGSRHYGDVLGASNMVRTKKDITGNLEDESIRKIRRKQREILLAKLMAKRQAQR